MSQDETHDSPPEEIHEDEIGIPESLRVKRRSYTMSDAALAQRQNAAKAPKPGMLGVRNNYKHGQFASNFANRIKPCKSTCDKYPCSMIEEGHTQPGGDCLDKLEILTFFRAVHDAVSSKKLESFNSIGSLLISNNLLILQQLQEDIMRDGTILKRETPTTAGVKIEYVLHPGLQALPKMLADLGMNPAEFMITPRAIAKQGSEDEGIRTLADLMSGIGKNVKKDTEK